MASRLARGREWFPRVPADPAEWRAQSFLLGSPEDVLDGLARWRRLGIRRVMLQLLDMDDLAAIELIAERVLPALA